MREMEELSKSIDSTIAGISSEQQPPAAAAEQTARRGGGAMKSLLNLFVSFDPEEGAAGAGAEAAAATPDPAAAQTTQQGPRVADLVAAEAHPTFEQPAGGGGDLAAKPLEEIYAEAGLADSQCSVDELAKLLENPAVASHPMSVKVVAVNLALSAKGVRADVPIADAVRRDRALDAYQTMLDERARAAEQRNAAQIEQLTREAEEYLKLKQAEMEALRAESAEAKRQAADFAERRAAEEKRLAELISPFLEGKPSPVTVANRGGGVNSPES